MKDENKTKKQLVYELTELRSQNAALKKSKSAKRYRSLVETIRDVIYELDSQGVVLYVSPAIRDLLGFDSAEIVEKNFIALAHKEDLSSLTEWFSELRQGREYPFEYSVIRKSGKLKWARVRTRPILEDGLFKDAHGILIDVTAQRRTEEALRESEARFRDLAELLPEVVFEIDQGGILTFANQNAFKSLGYTPKDFAFGLNVLDTVTPDDQGRALENIQRTLNGGDIGSNEVLMRRKDGSVFPALFYSTPIVRDDKSVGLLGIVVDITGRKRAEEELKQSLEKLHKTMGGIIQAMVLTVETRDPNTVGHQRRVADLARSIGQEMGLTKDQVEAIRMAGTVHDLGKISVPAEILSKPTKLSEQEFGLIKGHPQTCYDILKDIEFPWPIARIVSQHHERINCSGYPFGLKDQDILLEAKVLMVADVVEAIAFHRPYRVDYGIDIALDEISKNRGILYDPEVVDACLRLFREKGFKFIL